MLKRSVFTFLAAKNTGKMNSNKPKTVEKNKPAVKKTIIKFTGSSLWCKFCFILQIAVIRMEQS